MIRIILPFAVVASLLYAPLVERQVQYMDTNEVDSRIETAKNVFLDDAVACATRFEFNPLVEGCGPDKAGFEGWSMYAAAASSAVAGVLGILGLLPFIGRLTSIVTTAAGGISTAAIGNYIFGLWQSGTFETLQWGGWLAGGLSLLTLISGFAGMGGSRD